MPFMTAADFKQDWIKSLKGKHGEDELSGKRLDMPAFFASMEALVLGYHAVGVSFICCLACCACVPMAMWLEVWHYASGRAHIRLLHEIAANASHDDRKRRHVLAQFYDEIVRGEWQEQVKRGKFDISRVAGREC